MDVLVVIERRHVFPADLAGATSLSSAERCISERRTQAIRHHSRDDTYFAHANPDGWDISVLDQVHHAKVVGKRRRHRGNLDDTALSFDMFAWISSRFSGVSSKL